MIRIELKTCIHIYQRFCNHKSSYIRISFRLYVFYFFYVQFVLVLENLLRSFTYSYFRDTFFYFISKNNWIFVFLRMIYRCNVLRKRLERAISSSKEKRYRQRNIYDWVFARARKKYTTTSTGWPFNVWSGEKIRKLEELEKTVIVFIYFGFST